MNRQTKRLKKRLGTVMQRMEELRATLVFSVTMCEIRKGEHASMARLKTLLADHLKFVEAAIAAGAEHGE